MKKIKFVANYDDDKNIYNSILNCFPLSDEERQQITPYDDYDYLGILNGYKGVIKIPRERVFGFLQEPIGNINYDRNLHFYCSKIFCQSKEMFRPNKNLIESHLFMFYSNHINYQYKNFNNNFIKNKKLCIFISGISHPNNPNWNNSNYSKRLKLLDNIIKSDLDIDIYGRGLNISDKRYKGSPDNKHEILKNYEYSIAIENSCEKNYVSEKFFDCILNNTVPLYYGCPNVDEIFNNKCHEKINIEESQCIETIKILCESDSKKYYTYIQDAKNKYFNNFNPLRRILNEI